MQPQISTPSLLKALKHLLRERGLTYQDLAKHLGLSLPAVKRAMNQQDISMDRVLKVCGLLTIELRDLLDVASDPSSFSHHFSEAQELFFADNPSYLAYFFEIHQNHLQPNQIEKKHKIHARSSLKYLAKLESFGLIAKDKMKNYQSRVAPVISWEDHGPIGRVFSYSMLKGLSERVMKQIKSGQSTNLFLNGWHLQKTELEEFLREVTSLQSKYRRISVYNRRHRPNTQLDFFSVATMLDRRESMIFETVVDL